MGVLIIGIVSISLLVWTLASSLAAEAKADKRRGVQVGETNADTERTTTSINPGQAA